MTRPSARRRLVAALTLAAAARAAGAQAPTAAPNGVPAAPRAATPTAPSAAALDLTIANLMRGPELYGREPQNVRWTPDGRWLYFRWNAPGTDWREPLRPYRVRPTAGAAPERVTDAHADSVAPLLADGPTSPDRRLRVASVDGDLWLVDLRAGTARRLTHTAAFESAPTFSADGRTVYFVRDGNAFALALGDGAVRQLTDVRPGPQPDSARATPQRARLEADQRALFDVVRDRVAEDSVRAAERKAREARRPAVVWLAPGERVAQLVVSPRGDAVLLSTVTLSPRGRVAQVPDWVTPSGYVEQLPTRTKVGDEQAAGRAGWMKLGPDGAVGAVRWLRVVPSDTARAPAGLALVGWNPAGTAALVSAERRDYKERVLSLVTGDSGLVRTLDVLRDSAWVGGPCSGCAGWIDDRRAWFVSEADGWAHLYAVNADGGDRRQLTTGRSRCCRWSSRPTARTSACTRARARCSTATSTRCR